jgi:hypothetical protein
MRLPNKTDINDLDPNQPGDGAGPDLEPFWFYRALVHFPQSGSGDPDQG